MAVSEMVDGQKLRRPGAGSASGAGRLGREDWTGGAACDWLGTRIKGVSTSQPERAELDLTGWTQTDSGMWHQERGALLEIMNEDDGRWHGYVGDKEVGDGPDLQLVIDLVLASALKLG